MKLLARLLSYMALISFILLFTLEFSDRVLIYSGVLLLYITIIEGKIE